MLGLSDNKKRAKYQMFTLGSIFVIWFICVIYLHLSVGGGAANAPGLKFHLWVAIGTSFGLTLMALLLLRRYTDNETKSLQQGIQSLYELGAAFTTGHSGQAMPLAPTSLQEALLLTASSFRTKVAVVDVLAEFERGLAGDPTWQRVQDTLLNILCDIADEQQKSLVMRFADFDSSHHRLDAGSKKAVKQRLRLAESEEKLLYKSSPSTPLDLSEISPTLVNCQPNIDTTRCHVFPLAVGNGGFGFILVPLPPACDLPNSTQAALSAVAERAGSVLSQCEREASLYRQAHFDCLTGLPNRILLADRTNQALRLSKRNGHRVGIMFIDLDGFKRINDSLGHSAGDKLLQGVAERLQTCIRESDTVARLAGDEFVVLVSEISDSEQSNLVIGGIAKTIQNAVSRPFELNGKFVRVTPSIGVAVSSAKTDNYEALLQAADAAMYTAKSNGEGSIRFFQRDMSTTIVERMSLETELALAIDKKQLSIEYQPQVSLESGNVMGVEALLRWDHPTRGRISPARFIPLAEDSGIMSVIGNWALRKACSDASLWLREKHTLPLSINVSSAQLKQADMARLVKRSIAEFDLDPKLLCCEISESTAMHDTQYTARMLSELSKLGVTIAIDDFGTSYSSLAYLSDMPIQRLKIDKRFVDDLSLNNSAKTIIDAIVGLGHGLGLEVVGEGVENESQQRLLLEANCDLAQGYFYAEPMPVEKLLDFLGSRQVGSRNNVLHFPPKIQS